MRISTYLFSVQTFSININIICQKVNNFKLVSHWTSASISRGLLAELTYQCWTADGQHDGRPTVAVLLHPQSPDRTPKTQPGRRRAFFRATLRQPSCLQSVIRVTLTCITLLNSVQLVPWRHFRAEIPMKIGKRPSPHRRRCIFLICTALKLATSRGDVDPSLIHGFSCPPDTTDAECSRQTTVIGRLLTLTLGDGRRTVAKLFFVQRLGKSLFLEISNFVFVW